MSDDLHGFGDIAGKTLLFRQHLHFDAPHLLGEFAAIEQAALRGGMIAAREALREVEQAPLAEVLPLLAGHRAFHCDPDESGGLEETDPKHPDWHSRRAELWDSRPGK